MSADAFYALYGIRREFSASDETVLSLLELRKHPLQISARDHHLDAWWGNSPDGNSCYVLVGKMVAKLGAENQLSARVDDSDLRRLAKEVSTRLRAAGFDEQPALLFQFEVG